MTSLGGLRSQLNKKEYREFFIGLTALFLLILTLSAASHWLLSIIGPADTRLFLIINRQHTPFWDPVMYAASDKFFWFPFYAFLVYLVWKRFGKECWKPLLFIFLLILFTDQISSHLIKNLAERNRPSHEPSLIPLIHLSKAGPGGLYGFVSSHAANAAAIAVFLANLIDSRKNWLSILLLLWASLICYSRIYNGVHYPADVIVAVLIGIFSGWLCFRFFQLIITMRKTN